MPVAAVLSGFVDFALHAIRFELLEIRQATTKSLFACQLQSVSKCS
jgi:hypothetical protein